MNKLRVLVTGGSGFIGTNMIDNLIDGEFEVLNIDKSAPQNLQHNAIWKDIDILNYDSVEQAILNFDPEIILHLAAVTDLSGKDLSYYDANIKGVKNIVKIAGQLSSLQRIFFVSSMYVCQPGFIPRTYSTYKPHTVYGESKVKGELIVQSINSCRYSWTILRPTSIWGPWFNVPYIDFFNIVYRGKYFDFGKACTKSYGYVENTVFQIRKLMEADNVHGKTFYLGDIEPIQITEWANEISMEIHKKPIVKIPFTIIKIAALVGDLLVKFGVKFPMTSFRLTNMTTDNVLPLQNLYDVTGSPEIDRIDGIKKTLEWLKENRGYNY